MVHERNNWFTRYRSELPGERRLYKENLARFIRCMLNRGYMPCEIFTCGYENNLVGHIEIRFDARIVKNTSLLVEKYPCYMDWLNALHDWDIFISKEEFDNAFNVKLDDNEAFLRVFGMWEYVLNHMTRYIMQHEALYGEKEMWKKRMYY